MAIHSSILAWRISWIEEPGRLQSTGLQRVGTTERLHLLSFFCFTVGGAIGEGNGNALQYLAWKIPWTEEPGRLQSMRSLRVRHD